MIELNGKRNINNLFIILNVIAIYFNPIKLIPNYYIILLGRLLFGIVCGALNTCFGKILNDTIPDEVTHIYGLSTNAGINFGILLVQILSQVILPSQTDGTFENKHNQTWMILYTFCIVLETLSIILIVAFFKNSSLKDTIKYCSDEEARQEIRKIYRGASDETVADIKKELNDDSEKDTKEDEPQIGIV